MTPTDDPVARLVQPLFDGPLDLVGDIYGEIEALEVLLDRLGYDEVVGKSGSWANRVTWANVGNRGQVHFSSPVCA